MMSSDTTPSITPSTAGIPKLLYTRAEAAAMLSLSVRTIDALLASKTLTCRRIGKAVRIPHSALLAFTRRDTKIPNPAKIRIPEAVEPMAA